MFCGVFLCLCFAGPIAAMFWLDEELCSDLFLDGDYSFTLTRQSVYLYACLSLFNICLPMCDILHLSVFRKGFNLLGVIL